MEMIRSEELFQSSERGWLFNMRSSSSERSLYLAFKNLVREVVHSAASKRNSLPDKIGLPSLPESGVGPITTVVGNQRYKLMCADRTH